jgi:hypothetical protein
MNSGSDPIEDSIRAIEQARGRVSRIRARQITSADDRDYLKSVAYSWFRSHRPSLAVALPEEALGPVDTELRRVLDATARSSARTTYLAALRDAKSALTQLRSTALTSVVKAPIGDETPPNFTGLSADPVMIAILERRWHECQKCVRAGAPLAATVMMGGLLEALFVARANLLTNKTPLFRARSTPIDFKTKKPLALTEWTLRPYIDVAAELGWITGSGKDVAAILRDYRNYIHPEKERAHGVSLNEHDSSMFWDVTKSLARQLLASIVTSSASSP